MVVDLKLDRFVAKVVVPNLGRIFAATLHYMSDFHLPNNPVFRTPYTFISQLPFWKVANLAFSTLLRHCRPSSISDW